MATHLKLPYGLRDGQLFHISQVTNGLSCNCTCPGCDARLVARNQGKLKVPHFAHYQAQECVHGLQTALHLAAKDLFLKHQTFRLPGVEGCFELTNAFWRRFSFDARRYLNRTLGEALDESFYEYPGRYTAVRNVLLERKTEDVVPDIILETDRGLLLVEVAVTHFIDEAKREKIKRLDVPTIEIDLSNLPRNLALGQLEELLIHGVEEKYWVYNRKLRERILAQREIYYQTLEPYFERAHQRKLQRIAALKRRWPLLERSQRRKTQRRVLHSLLQQQTQLQAALEQQGRVQEAEALFARRHKAVVLCDVTNGTNPQALKVKHIYSCPIEPRSHEGRFYASLEVDCRRCRYFKGYKVHQQQIECHFH